MFYFEDHYPDSHLLGDAEYLRQSFDPDFLYIHTVNIDDAGHKFTSNSAGYRGSALRVDSLLARLFPTWMASGYHIVISSDHGMNEDGHHGGPGDGERYVGMVAIGEQFKPGIYVDEVVPQLAIAPLICRLLDIPPSDKMQAIEISGLR